MWENPAGSKILIMAEKLRSVKGATAHAIRKEIQDTYRRSSGDHEPVIVFVSGNFNIIHPGHQRLIQFASELGDCLVIGVNPDSEPGTMFPQSVRVASISKLSLVDYVIALKDGELLDAIRALKPNMVVKGAEHERAENLEKAVLSEYGGKLVFGSGEQKFTSLDLLRKDFENIQYSSIVQPEEYLATHSIQVGRVKETMARSKGLRVIVVGDTIVDEYITCEALGLSQEDPTIVVNPIHRIKFLGGAAIVAAHASGLGADVQFFSVLGKDAIAGFATAELDKCKVNHTLLSDSARPTTLKQRYRAREKTLLRVNELSQRSIPREIRADIFKKLKAAIPKADLLVFSDFNYGCLPTDLVLQICEVCRKHNVMMVADSQSSSQIGDVSRFKGMKLLTPTEREARLAVNDFESGLVVLADTLMEKASAENVFVTLGAEGLLIRSKLNSGLIDKLPALNAAPRDPAGAGDSLLIASSLVLAAGGTIWEAAYLGSLAAAIQVSRVGNTPLTLEELFAEMKTDPLSSGLAS